MLSGLGLCRECDGGQYPSRAASMLMPGMLRAATRRQQRMHLLPWAGAIVPARVLNRDPGLKILELEAKEVRVGPGLRVQDKRTRTYGGSSPRLCSMAPDSAGGESRSIRIELRTHGSAKPLPDFLLSLPPPDRNLAGEAPRDDRVRSRSPVPKPTPDAASSAGSD